MFPELLVVNSFVQGYHEYMDVWQPKVNEEYFLKREPSNKTDKNAVAVINECGVSCSPQRSKVEHGSCWPHPIINGRIGHKVS